MKDIGQKKSATIRELGKIKINVVSSELTIDLMRSFLQSEIELREVDIDRMCLKIVSFG